MSDINMTLNETDNRERDLSIDILRYILIFSFMWAHLFPQLINPIIEAGVYWNTGGFVILSGYLTGIFLNKRPLNFKYGLVKFIKINFWIVIYLILAFFQYLVAKKTNLFFFYSTNDISVLEYIALFYLMIPLITFSKRKYPLLLIFISSIIIITYYSLIFSSENTILQQMINLLFIGNSCSFNHYPLLSFVNIGFIGFLFGRTKNKIPSRKWLQIVILITLLIVYFLNCNNVIKVWIDRYPPLLFYIIFSLTIFSILIDISTTLSSYISKPFIRRIILSTSRFSIVIYAIHRPFFRILDKIGIKYFMSGCYLPDLLLSVLLILIIIFFLCLFLENTIGKLPNKIVKKLL